MDATIPMVWYGMVWYQYGIQYTIPFVRPHSAAVRSPFGTRKTKNEGVGQRMQMISQIGC